MIAKSGKVFQKYGQGKTIGESDCFLGETRDCKAVAAEACVLFIVPMDQCLQLFERHSKVYEELQQQAGIKRHNHLQKIQKADEKMPNFDKFAKVFTNKLKKYGISDQ